MSYGEAAIAVLVKPLQSAMEDGDRIHAVIAGSAANHNGARAFSALAPDSDSIAEVVIAAWKDAGKPFDRIGYLEAHGSGTKLGDGLEIEAYSLVRRAAAPRSEVSYHLSSAKSAVGHAMAASGLTSFVRGVLAVREGRRFPILHAEPPNPLIDFSQSGAILSPDVADWPAPSEQRLAGVTSCGLSGTNVHVVLAGAPAPAGRTDDRQTDLIALSGRSPENLADKAEALRDWLQDRPDVSVTDLCKTLLAGRPHGESRLAIRAPNRDALLHSLDAQCRVPADGDHAAPAPLDRVICVMEAEADLSGLLARYRAAVPDFTRFAEACETAIEELRIGDKSKSLDWFVFRYALLKSLIHLGCVGRDVVAVGNGGLIARAVSDDPGSLRASLSQAAAAPTKFLDNPSAAAAKLLGTLKPGERALFVFLGGQSAIARELKRSEVSSTGAAPATAVVREFNGDPAADILDLIEVAYTAGRPFRADRLEHWLPGSRIAAPGEVFRKARYWPLPNGNSGRSVRKGRESRDIEAEIRAVWCDLLGVEALSDEADFFESGGDSLAGTKLIRLMEHRLGVTLEFEDIFDFPTLASFSDHVIAMGGAVRPEGPSPQPEEPPAVAAQPDVTGPQVGKLQQEGAASETEAAICAIFADVLDHDAIGPHSNFFELGGTSLLAAQLFGRIKLLTGKVFPLAVLFEAQTPRELAALLETGSGAESVERGLLEIASVVTGCPDIRLDSNFFELGGSSLMAAQLFARIRNRWGLHYSLSILFDDQTPRALAARIAADLGQTEQGKHDEPEKRSSLVKLRSGGYGVPIFLVHNSTGDVYQYLPLVRSLPKGRPIYGVCASGLAKGSPIPPLEDMIAGYTEEIASVDPRPAILVGHSIGGILAREIAQVLSDSGNPPQFVGMIDSGFDWHDRMLSPARRYAAEVRFFIRLFPLKFSTILRNRGLLPGAEKPPEHYPWMEDTLNHIINRYGIRRYSLRAKLYYAPEGAKKNAEDDYGWDGFLSEVEVEKLSGDHWSILTWDHVDGLAKAISRDLNLETRQD